MQTLSNIVAALRDNDFSFRARGARRGDAMGDLALEINALASTLQQQRSKRIGRAGAGRPGDDIDAVAGGGL